MNTSKTYAKDSDGFVIVDFVDSVKREMISKTSWLDTCYLPTELVTGDEDFRTLWNLHPPVHHEVVIYGKSIPIPRWQQAYLRDYKFSGVVSTILPLPDEFEPYLTWANSLEYEGKFNAILVNWYQNGEHYIGSHADDESQLIPDSPIITITLCSPGEPRKFRIRNMKKEIVKDILTPNGLVLVMGGRFQKEFKHEIVKMTGAAAKKAGARISITLRQFK